MAKLRERQIAHPLVSAFFAEIGEFSAKDAAERAGIDRTIISHWRNGRVQSPKLADFDFFVQAMGYELIFRKVESTKDANEIERFRSALIDVTNPIDYLRRYAEKQGAVLNGSAHSIANDLHFVQRIAREALETDPAPPLQNVVVPEIYAVLEEMRQVAIAENRRGEDEWDGWNIDNRAQVDEWQGRIRSALSNSATEGSEG